MEDVKVGFTGFTSENSLFCCIENLGFAVVINMHLCLLFYLLWRHLTIGRSSSNSVYIELWVSNDGNDVNVFLYLRTLLYSTC